MNIKNTTQEIVLGGLLLASGVILPMVFHVFGMTGPIFLPMHIPVLIAGFLLSPQLALIVGILTPLLSSIFTGMPVMFPIAVIMAFELGVYALAASIAVRKLNLSTVPSLLIAMLSGRFAAGISVALLVQLFGIKMNALIYLKGAVITGIPGILLQLVMVPILVIAIRKYLKIASVQA
ncbi:MAG: transporter component [Firmicutes bacterium]|nr:transporter component [Bacillota bacterium]